MTSLLRWVNSFSALLGQFITGGYTFKVTLDPATEPIDTRAGVEETLDAIGERVTQIRGLPAPPALKRSFQTREEFIMKAEAELLDEETRLEVERLKDICVVLDLCSQSDDLQEVLLDLLRQGVLGYYKSEEKSLTVVTNQEEPDLLAWLTYTHKYAHALQDEKFDLSIILELEEDTFDSSRAATALVEGDANFTEYLFYESLPLEQQVSLAESLKQATDEFSSSPEAAQAPRIIRETFGWEHSAGPEFVFRLYLRGGFDAINEAYQDPPGPLSRFSILRSTSPGRLPTSLTCRTWPWPWVMAGSRGIQVFWENSSRASTWAPF